MAVRHGTILEVEIKLRVRNIAPLLQELQRLGASAHGRVLERNTLYDTPDSNFRRTGRLLRVRIEIPAGSGALTAGRKNAVVTFKTPAPAFARSRYKAKQEREVEIPRPAAWGRMLRRVGFRAGFRYEKYRSSFRLPGIHACLDETPVGTFLELEGSPAAIDRLAHKLGYGRRDYIRGTYWDLYAADCARRGRLPRNMLLGK